MNHRIVFGATGLEVSPICFGTWQFSPRFWGEQSKTDLLAAMNTNGPLVEIPFVKRILLVTAHRRENFGEPIRAICEALKMIAKRYTDHVHIVYPVHLNPNIWEPVHTLLSGVSNITLLKSLDYLFFVHLMKQNYPIYELFKEALFIIWRFCRGPIVP